MSVTTNILQRTFNIRCAGNSGTCFSIDLDGGRYLVTARHVVGGIRDRGVMEILHSGRWVPIQAHLVGHGQGNVDVSVLSPEVLFGANHALRATTAHLMLAEVTCPQV